MLDTEVACREAHEGHGGKRGREEVHRATSTKEKKRKVRTGAGEKSSSTFKFCAQNDGFFYF